jgi:hypothetical protein
MALPLLLAAASGMEIVGLDLGNQFLKMAKSRPDGQVEIVMHSVLNSANHRASTAIKFLKPTASLDTELDFEGIEVRFGDSARRLLKANASHGYDLPLRGLGRENNTEFRTGQIATEFELFMLMLEMALGSVAPFYGIVLAVPVFFTREQLKYIRLACMEFRVPLISMETDVGAVLTAYGALRVARFAQSPKRVLFVDVGAMATRAYSATFEYRASEGNSGDFVEAIQLSLEWSEKVGGYHFSKALAAGKNISIYKAEKLLQRNNGDGYEAFVENELDVLENIVSSAVSAAEGTGPIDEVQVIGGASTLKFVVEAIRRATNHSIRRDFNPSEAIALGAAIAGLAIRERSPYVEVRTSTLASVTINVTCGDISLPFCWKGGSCHSFVDFTELPSICENFSVDAGLNAIPDGVSPQIASFYMTSPVNLSGSGNFSARFLMSEDLAIQGVRWCNDEGVCANHEAAESDSSAFRSLINSTFVTKYLTARENVILRKILAERLTKLNAFRAKIERANVESPREMTEAMKDVLTQLTTMREGGLFENLNSTELHEWNGKLEAIGQKLHVKLTD